VVTESDWDWLDCDELLELLSAPLELLSEPLEPVSELVEPLEESSELVPEPVDVLVPVSSLWLRVSLEPDDVVVAAVGELPPLPRAATASQAATKVASAPAATRRRTMRRRRLMGGFGSCMTSMVDRQPWILLGIRSGSRRAFDF
jgi:hypothetical protein